MNPLASIIDNLPHMTPMPSRWRGWTWVAIVVHFSVILTLGLFRHWGYLSSLNDLGAFDQAVWGTLNGEPLLNTSNLFSKPINWLGFHFHPVLLLFVSFYALSPSAEWFVLAQAAALSLAAWPIFLLANRVCQSEKTGLLWALIYLANPFLLNAATWDFHPVALAVPLVALGMLAVEKHDSRLLWLSCLPLLLVQEQLGLTVSGFGLLWGLRNRSWQTAACLIALGITHTALVLGVIMPAFSPTGGHLMISSDLGQLSRYGWLGKSVGNVVATTLGNPLLVTRIVIFNLGGLLYVFLLLAPLLFLPLAAIAFLLPGLADLGVNMLSANPMPRSVFSYHSVTLVPILIAAAIHGAKRISSKVKRYSLSELVGLALVSSLACGYFLSPLPLPGAHNSWAQTHFINWPDPILPAVLAAAGKNASVSAQANIGAHFSQRREIYLYPNKSGEAEVIVLRMESPTDRLLPQNIGRGDTLAGHLQMHPADYLASISCLLNGKRHYPVLWDDPWLVLKRGAANPTADPSLDGRIRQKLQQLQVDWRVEAEEYREALQRCGEPKTP